MKSRPRVSITLPGCWVLVAFLATGGVIDAQHYEYKEHHLGPTGLFGVTSPKDIKITKVEKGSPADGRIKVGDVITAAGGMEFKEQTRKQLAAAIDKAESKEGGGRLSFTLEGGKSVDITLPVLGSWSDAAPFECAKTDAIIMRAADSLARSKSFASHGLPIDLLGLLATGDPKHIDVVKEQVHKAKWAAPDVKPPLSPASSAWSYGYTNMLLCEYFLATHDQYVLPAIKAYSMALAMGRDAAGLWGHRMADPEANRGQLHGRLFGYAVMNQSSLPCFISLLLARKCGIEDPEISAAIEQNQTFYAGFIGKGTLPYGVHDPNSKSFNNNGMSGLATVAFSLCEDKEGARFFSRMSTAGHQTLEQGHTGHFFSQMWTGLGANLAGPEASSAFFRETRWLHTLNRRWDGGFIYDGCDSKEGNYSYRGLSDTGSHLLNLCLARKKLLITGRDADQSIWMKKPEVSETISLATLDMKKLGDDALLNLFGHPLPKIRQEAIWTLRLRDHNLHAAIRKMFAEEGLRQESAIEYFGYGCPKERMIPAKDDLAAIMRDSARNMAIRADAASALCWLEQDAFPFYQEILRLVLAEKPDDPLGAIDEQLGRSLVNVSPDPYAAGLVKDKDLFYAAVHKLLDHRRVSGRSAGMKLIAKVPIEDFHIVADKVVYIIEDKDLTYHSYHNLDAKNGAISIFANLGIEGGIEYAFATLDDKTGKAGFKIRLLLDVLPKYGANAKYALPKIKVVNAGKFQKQWDAMIKTIETATGNTKMISIDEARKAGRKS